MVDNNPSQSNQRARSGDHVAQERFQSRAVIRASDIPHSRRYSISQEICTRFFALLCSVVVIHWLIFPYPSGLLHWHCGYLTIAPVPAKQPWWIWINTSCEFIMNDCITTTKQRTTKPCAYSLGYTVHGDVMTWKRFPHYWLSEGASDVEIWSFSVLTVKSLI